MSYSLSALQALSDEQLIAEHDSVAKNAGVGTAYYVDELNRRTAERASRANEAATAAALRLAGRSFWLTVANAFLGLSALVVSLVALLK